MFTLYSTLQKNLFVGIFQKETPQIHPIFQRVKETQRKLFHTIGKASEILLFLLFLFCPIVELFGDLIKYKMITVNPIPFRGLLNAVKYDSLTLLVVQKLEMNSGLMRPAPHSDTKSVILNATNAPINRSPSTWIHCCHHYYNFIELTLIAGSSGLSPKFISTFAVHSACTLKYLADSIKRNNEISRSDGLSLSSPVESGKWKREIKQFGVRNASLRYLQSIVKINIEH